MLQNLHFVSDSFVLSIKLATFYRKNSVTKEVIDQVRDVLLIAEIRALCSSCDLVIVVVPGTLWSLGYSEMLLRVNEAIQFSQSHSFPRRFMLLYRLLQEEPRHLHSERKYLVC